MGFLTFERPTLRNQLPPVSNLKPLRLIEMPSKDPSLETKRPQTVQNKKARWIGRSFLKVRFSKICHGPKFVVVEFTGMSVCPCFDGRISIAFALHRGQSWLYTQQIPQRPRSGTSAVRGDRGKLWRSRWGDTGSSQLTPLMRGFNMFHSQKR